MDTSTSIGRFINYKNLNGITPPNSSMPNLFFLPSFVSSKEPHPAKILPVKVGMSGPVSTAIKERIPYAAQRGADVISMDSISPRNHGDVPKMCEDSIFGLKELPFLRH